MKVLYVGLLYQEDKQEELLEISRVGLPNACNILQWNIIRALRKKQVSIEVINSLPMGVYPRLCTRKYFDSIDWSDARDEIVGHEIGFINFYFVKHMGRGKNIKRLVDKWIEINQASGDALTVMFYDIYLPFLNVNTYIKKKYKDQVQTCIIIGDLRGKYAYDMGIKGVKRIFMNIRDNKCLKNAKYADKYVLLTDEMAKVLHIEDKPFVRIEGIADTNSVNYTAITSTKKVIMYAGGLSTQYGVKLLVDAFTKIHDQNIGLWICGQGELEDYIKQQATIDQRIVFYGYVSKEKVRELEKQVAVFINPRPNLGEYTKYSFPSKIIENMLAGRPVICFKLPGIPDEYDDYLNYVEKYDEESISNAIISTLKKDVDTLNAEGKRNREFIISNKSKEIQIEKIIDLLGREL